MQALADLEPTDGSAAGSRHAARRPKADVPGMALIGQSASRRDRPERPGRTQALRRHRLVGGRNTDKATSRGVNGIPWRPTRSAQRSPARKRVCRHATPWNATLRAGSIGPVGDAIPRGLAARRQPIAHTRSHAPWSGPVPQRRAPPRDGAAVLPADLPEAPRPVRRGASDAGPGRADPSTGRDVGGQRGAGIAEQPCGFKAEGLRRLQAANRPQGGGATCPGAVSLARAAQGGSAA